MRRITPCLWFNNQAVEAVDFYLGIFKDSKKGDTTYYGKSSAAVSGQPEGKVLTVGFELNGADYLALNGGPEFKFTQAISMMVWCETQEEIDYYWEKLQADGGKPSQCGWLEDKFGLSWQVVPTYIEEAMKDPAKHERMMAALVQMTKLDLAALKTAAENN
ncbi:MAG: VOC family protein [Candidatus Obscuribacterales bacterium]|nr:VOC family protein [Candidatus Obscuribacterales bacterium]